MRNTSKVMKVKSTGLEHRKSELQVCVSKHWTTRCLQKETEKNNIERSKQELGEVVYTCNPSTWRPETGGLP